MMMMVHLKNPSVGGITMAGFKDVSIVQRAINATLQPTPAKTEDNYMGHLEALLASNTDAYIEVHTFGAMSMDIEFNSHLSTSIWTSASKHHHMLSKDNGEPDAQ
jgi:hypothetical protein